MSAIIDFFNKVLGKQDETLTAVGSIAKDFEALKLSASEKESQIQSLTTDLESVRAELDAEKAKAATLETAAKEFNATLEAKSAEVDKIAAAKALEITQKQGQPALTMDAPANPAANQPAKANLKGRDLLIHALSQQTK